MELGRDLSVVVFDFDGTLLDLGVDWHAVRRELGVDGTTETLGEAIARLARTRDPLLSVATEWELAALGDRRLEPPVATTLGKLATAYRLAVLTRNSREVVTRAFAGTPVAAELVIVGREDTARLKPDPQGLYRILEHHRATPEQAVLVGDTYHDVEAAQAAGARSVVVHNPRLDYPPVGADAYVREIPELLPLLT